MKGKTKENIITVLLTVAFVLLVLMIIASFPSCSFARKATSDKQNNSQVKKTDSVAVSKSGSTASNENTWFKEWITMGGANRDSFVSKETQLQPIYHTSTQPVVIYREGGTNKQEQKNFNFDSAVLSKLDSLNKDKAVETVSTKAEVLSMWQIIGIMAGLALFAWIIPRPKISFKN